MRLIAMAKRMAPFHRYQGIEKNSMCSFCLSIQRLVIDAYSSPGEAPSIALARGRNVRDRIVDGSLGVALDSNRITVRLAGVSLDGNHIKIWFLPEGAVMPPGGQEVDPGPVNSEKKAPDDELHNQKSKRKPQR